MGQRIVGLGDEPQDLFRHAIEQFGELIVVHSCIPME